MGPCVHAGLGIHGLLAQSVLVIDQVEGGVNNSASMADLSDDLGAGILSEAHFSIPVATDGSTTSTIPMPILNTRCISQSETCPSDAIHSNSG